MAITLAISLRHKLYSAALKDYLSPQFGDNKRNVSAGFCHYFMEAHALNVYNPQVFKHLLPELWYQKPRSTPEGKWFPVWGPTAERISCLENAMREIEELDYSLKLNQKSEI